MIASYILFDVGGRAWDMTLILPEPCAAHGYTRASRCVLCGGDGYAPDRPFASGALFAHAGECRALGFARLYGILSPRVPPTVFSVRN